MLVAGWVDATSDPSVLIIDIQICKELTPVLFAVSNGSETEYGIGTYAMYVHVPKSEKLASISSKKSNHFL